ncbi:MAG: DUF932 domain-containing protein [Candidatus Accumulibacter propinquus]|jgi:hypothetical protein
MTTTPIWEARDPVDAFFPVELRPLFMPAEDALNDFQELKRHFAVVDLERQHPFAVVTDDYELVTNKAAYDMAAEVMKKVFHTTQIGDMACLNITMPKTRSFCHIDLIHKTADFSPWEKDTWTAFLRISNSYNRTRLLRFELGFCRWICLNGIIFGSKSIEFSYAHTRRGMDRVDRFVENIGDIRKLETALTEKLHQLKRYHVPEKEMLPLLCRAFDIKATKDVVEKQRRVDDLLALRDQAESLTKAYFTEMGPHGYAALNVLTDYASRPAGVIAPEASMHGLQQKAGSWMDDFISAIKNPDFSFDSYLADYRQTAEVIESL